MARGNINVEVSCSVLMTTIKEVNCKELERFREWKEAQP